MHSSHTRLRTVLGGLAVAAVSAGGMLAVAAVPTPAAQGCWRKAHPALRFVPVAAVVPAPLVAPPPPAWDVPPKATGGRPDDHTMFGGTPSRNMRNLVEKGLKEKVEDHGGSALLWKAELGTKSYTGAIVAAGKVLAGTNNYGNPRNPRDTHKNADGVVEPTDKGVLLCFEETDGKFLWQLVFDKLPSGRVHDFPEYGICATPTVEGDRIYFVSNRCAVVCASLNGPADRAKGVKRSGYDTPTDGVILWEFDMMGKLNVFPHNLAVCCPLVVGDLLYVVTANGVDEGHFNVPQPTAPSFICLNKNDGKLVWQSNAPGRGILHGQWSNPVFSDAGGVKQVIFPGGDGWLYSFAPETGELLWKFDCNPKDAVYELAGTGTRNDFIGTPVVYDNKVYIGVGQDPEHSTGVGHFWSVDIPKAVANAKKNPNKDVSSELVDKVEKTPEGETRMTGKPNPDSAMAWHFGGDNPDQLAVRAFKFGRTMSTATIVDDVVYIAELSGILHCLNAQTGEHNWQYDTKAAIWGSTYYCDGKVYLGTDADELIVFRHDPKPAKMDELDVKAKDQKDHRAQRLVLRKKWEEKYLIGKAEFDGHIKSTPTIANGVLYVMTEKTLYAIKMK
jgi:outer membrane protein assembly factor BamB